MTIFKVMIEFKMGNSNFWECYNTFQHLDRAIDSAKTLKEKHPDQEVVVQKVEETTVYTA